MRKILFYNPTLDRYHYVNYEEKWGYLEFGSTTLRNSNSLYPEEKMRIVAAGSGDNPRSKIFTTPRYSTRMLQEKFDSWLSKYKRLDLQLDVEAG